MNKKALTITIVANMTSNYSESLEISPVYKRYLEIEKCIQFEAERVLKMQL